MFDRLNETNLDDEEEIDKVLEELKKYAPFLIVADQIVDAAFDGNYTN
jgi:hypothetical protein